MLSRKLAFALFALVLAPMATGCIVAERPAYYYRPARVHYYRPVTHVVILGSAEAPSAATSPENG